MAGSLELLGQNKTLQNKIQAHFNLANQALAGGLEQNQELFINTQQTFSQSIDAQAQVTSPQAQATARNNGGVSVLSSGGIADYDQNKQLQNHQLELEPRTAEDEKAARQAELNAKAAKEKQQQVSAQEFNVAAVALDDFRNKYLAGNGFQKQGRLIFHNQALDVIFGDQNLTPAQKKELTGKVIKDLDDVDKQTTIQQKFIDDAEKQKTDLTQQTFNFQVPVKKGYVSNVAYPEDNIDNTHGYPYLSKNVVFRRAINTTANKLGIPGSWIADIIAVETSFNPREFHRMNSCGYGGLIGFGADDAQEFGTTLRHILSLPPERQMVYVEKYLSRPKIKRHLNRGVEYVAAAVFGGRGLLNKLIKNPSKALRTSDGAINLQTYMQRLGRDVGRRYDFTTHRQTKPTIFSISRDLQSRVQFSQQMQQAN